jgi:uncharacterized membrane protein YhfC
MQLVNIGWLVSLAVAALFVILYPLVLAIIAHGRLHVSWRYFGYGALIFFLFQLITRVPLVLWIQSRIAPDLKASATLSITWIALLALTAGLTEEIGRYVGYRWLMKREEKTWSKAVMYGIGHGGLESMVLVGGQLLLILINIVTMMILLHSNPNILPVSQRIAIAHQFATINATPAWAPLLGAWERLWTLPFHIAMSLVVLQVFRRHAIGWLWLAVLAHTLLDFITALMPQVLGSSMGTSLLIEGIVAVSGIIGIWVIWRLRDRPESTTTAGTGPLDVRPETTV